MRDFWVATLVLCSIFSTVSLIITAEFQIKEYELLKELSEVQS